MQTEQTIGGLSILDRFDQTKNYTLVEDDDVIPISATRWVFAAGNTLPRTRMRETGFVYGGVETSNRCLRRTQWGNGNYIPRLVFTPVEIWHEPTPIEQVSSEPGFTDVMTIKDSGGTQSQVPSGHEAFYKSIARVKMYPGRQIRMITDGLQDRICEVELKALAGIDYDSGTAQTLNRAFFPKEFMDQALRDEIPLSAVRDRIRSVIDVEGKKNSQIASLGDDMLHSCDLFETWANERIGVNHANLRSRRSKDHIFRYDPVVLETLLPQMEVAREDTPFQPKQMDTSGADMAQILKDSQEMMMQKIIESDERLAAADKARSEQDSRMSEMQKTVIELMSKLTAAGTPAAPPKGK